MKSLIYETSLNTNHILSLARENELLRQEIRVSREAAEITANLVVAQFEETEKILRRFQVANAQRRAVLNSAAQISIIATDTSGIIRTFNTGAENLLGYRAAEIIGKETPEIFLMESVLNSYGDQISKEHGPRIKGLVDMLFQYALLDSSEQLEWIYVKKDGTRFPVDMTINALREPDGTVSGMLCIANDISERKRAESILKKANDELEKRVQQRTAELAKANLELQTEIRERRQAEEALRGSEAKYRSIFENAAEGIFQTSPGGRLITANPAMAKMLGYESPEDIINNIDNMRTQVYVDPQRRDNLKELMEKNGYVKNFEADYYKKDGSIINVCINGHLVRDEQDNSLYYEGMLEDITQKKRSEELKIAKEAAEAATRAKSDFIANMSHEIRTPMNAIIGLTDLAIKNNMTAKHKDYLHKIHLSAHSLLGIINDILDFSKIEAGRLDLEYREFKISNVLDNISDMFSSRIAEKGIEMIMSVADNVPHILIGDSLRLSQVLINLANNALKFTEKGEVVIKISLFKQDKDQVRLKFHISDTGIGIHRKYLPDLFKSFTQADSSITRKYGGTGLGLTICRQLVLMMKGEIWAESEPGKGTDIYFTAVFDIKKDFKQNTRIPPLKIRGLRIMIIDNNETAREIYTEILNSLTYRVTPLGSGQEALKELKKESRGMDPYKLVITDWRMPGMDGIETLKAIKKDPDLGDIPVIMMTAFGREEIMLKAQEAGANAFLIKPVKQSLLFDTIINTFDNAGNQDPALNHFLQPEENSLEQHRQLQGVRILLVEDNIINQQVALEILQQAGIIVETADNGKQALTAVCSSPYDALLMDVQMPEMDGYEATRRIRNLDFKNIADMPGDLSTKTLDHKLKNIPIIAMTAHAMKGDMEKCIDAGMNDYVTKPINTELLFSILEKWIKIKPDTKPDIKPDIKTDTSKKYLFNINEIPGIDMESGLKRINNPRILIKLIINFIKEHKSDAAAVRDMFQKGDTESALKKIHAIKGAAGNLSAQRLFKAAQDLENAVFRCENIDKLTDEFEDALYQVTQSSSILEQSSTNQKPCINDADTINANLNIEKIKDIIINLANYLNANDLEAESCFQALKQYISISSYKDQIKEIGRDIDSLEFSNALKKLNVFAEELNISLGEDIKIES
ncbi:Two component system response regulator/histidine kinase [Desulfonema limicola]|uniref:Sensory/regulatory protein RpfC n=1 Tax=Desulfonema limicola TaxID=45656 RepID=A0A975GEL6_9BACT|nr:PAS domain-containing hybrid sensor histidine kinase/response regulator [Desulfonema limicola]QTA78328.1 Two component system response regulator/histidine kinase [Desulfonema limicola]